MSYQTIYDCAREHPSKTAVVYNGNVISYSAFARAIAGTISHLETQALPEGHTVVVIEHHTAIMAEADYLIDIGPEAGEQGGRIVSQGTPERVAGSKKSHTAPFLKEALAIR